MLTCGKCVASWRKGRARRQITFIGRTVFISRSWTVSGCSSSGVECARCGNSGSTVRDTTNTTFAATAYLTSPRSLPKQILGHAVTHACQYPAADTGDGRDAALLHQRPTAVICYTSRRVGRVEASTTSQQRKGCTKWVESGCSYRLTDAIKGCTWQIHSHLRYTTSIF